ncbi:hypothetical protein QMA10_14775 [Arthrobacter sp. APC 3897]|uniref:hypothetical protein n=1 Tax=Arthrobacter sp. APC 3897 TaxID=3035204 RepID=UPI0025B3F69C|nr:hypothetical protein [Arthrobacter sp. APC 3897]MDN3483179.1 hypothetical protein [Arthrobacter sp. APC 3897]
MGNHQRTPEEEYRHYARPEPGRAGDSVEVIDDGRGRQSSAAQPSGLPDPAPGTPDPAGSADGRVPASAPSEVPVPAPHRRNVSLWAAWVLVALMLAVGLGWLFGFIASPWDTYQASTMPESSRSWAELRLNMYALGPQLTAAGLLGAVILLAVQASLHQRRGARTD